MNILYNVYPQHNYMDATIIDGLKALGHKVFGAGGIESSYAEPHNGEDYDLYFHSGRRLHRPPAEVVVGLRDVPKIFIWGHDSGIERETKEFPDLSALGFDAYFIKDLRKVSGNNVFPIHHGIEDRFYCATEEKRLPLIDRPIDILFVGKYEGKLYGHRKTLLDAIQEEFGTDYNFVFKSFQFNEIDNERSKLMGEHVKHYSDYYQLLSTAKIILCPMGATPDQLKRWEALASGAVVLAQFMPIVHIQPWLRNRTDYFWFCGIDDCIYTIREILGDLVRAQTVADTGFETGRKYHTTKERARYILRCLSELNLVGGKLNAIH
jgi:hypothetical protein